MALSRPPTRSASRLSLLRVLIVLASTTLVVAACSSSAPTARPSGSARGPLGGASASPQGSTLGASSQTSEPTLPFCKATDMKAAILRWEGGAGSRFATVIVTSRSGVTCIVRGRPGVRLLDAKGKIVLDSAAIKGIGGPKVAKGDPAVVLGPGDELQLDIQWTNWCKSQPARPITVGLVLTDRGGLLKAARAPVSGGDDAPPCTSKAKSAEIRVTHAWFGPGI